MNEIDRSAISARAYALYVRGGRRPGRALDDWLDAERQLKAEAGRGTGASPQRSLAGTTQPSAQRPGSPSTPAAASIPAAHFEAAKGVAKSWTAPTPPRPSLLVQQSKSTQPNKLGTPSPSPKPSGPAPATGLERRQGWQERQEEVGSARGRRPRPAPPAVAVPGGWTA
jgi:hypothetical protein